MARRLLTSALSKSITWTSGPCWREAPADSVASLHLQLTFSRSFATAAAPTAFLDGSSSLRSAWQQLGSLLHIYKQLSKARLSALVVSTAATGFVAGSGTVVEWDRLGWTALGTMGAASAANALNQLAEIRQDSVMKRTMRRPLPIGAISRVHAFSFAGIVGLAGVGLLAAKTNWSAAGLGAANIALYAGVYTYLKMVSPISTWVGALVGAIPPLMGWAAAGNQLDRGGAVLAGILYFWQAGVGIMGPLICTADWFWVCYQIPHFLALAWLCRADYARGGYSMLPLLDAAGRRTGACMLRNCLYLLPLGPAALAAGVAGPAFACTASVATGVFAATAAAFARTPSAQAARSVFRASLIYLPVILAAALLDRVPRQPTAAGCRTSALAGSRVSGGEEGSAQEPAREPGPAAWPLTLAPFPFLPVPAHLVLPVLAGAGHSQDLQHASTAN